MGRTLARCNLLEIVDADEILDHCALTLANPCAAHLVTAAVGRRAVTSVHTEDGHFVTIGRFARFIVALHPAKVREIGCLRVARGASLPSARTRL